jgi:CRP-like cAMP-binding protein
MFGAAAASLYKYAQSRSLARGMGCASSKPPKTVTVDGVQLYERKSFPKSDEEAALLKRALQAHPIFDYREESVIDDVVSAMEVFDRPAGQVVKQGDRDSRFYVIFSGDLQATIASGAVVSSYTSGDAFGELALLYDSPRAASVSATGPCRLFSLERAAYRALVVESTTDAAMKSGQQTGTAMAFGNSSVSAPQELWRRNYKVSHPKTKEEATKVKKALRTHPLFEYLDDELMGEIVDAMVSCTGIAHAPARRATHSRRHRNAWRKCWLERASTGLSVTRCHVVWTRREH